MSRIYSFPSSKASSENGSRSGRSGGNGGHSSGDPRLGEGVASGRVLEGMSRVPEGPKLPPKEELRD